jgi:hypothetical protein
MFGHRRILPGRVPLLLAAVALVAALAVVGAAGPARAETVHEPLFELAEVPDEGPHGEPVPVPGPRLNNSQSMTVDAGHVWLAEGSLFGQSRVDEFDAKTGAFIAQPMHLEKSPDLLHPTCYGYGCGEGVAVGHGPGEAAVYVAGEQNGVSAVSVFNEAGALKATWNGAATPEGSFGVFTGFKGETVGTITDVAVDNSTNPLNSGRGDVFVEVGVPFDESNTKKQPRVIDVFHPEMDGEERYIGQITGPSSSEPFGLIPRMAVDEANGDLFVTDEGGEESAVDVFEPSGLGSYAFVHKLKGPPPTGTFNSIGSPVAVDSATGEVYVTESGRIDQFGATDTYLGHVENPPTTSALAVDPESHYLYTTSVVYGPDLVVPDVTTGAVSGQTPRSVTLNGTVDPDGVGEASCQFDWGTTPALGEVAPCEPETVPNGEGPVAVQAVLKSFERNTTYYYRLQASDAQGTNPGEAVQDRQFTTSGAAIHSASALDVSADSATFGANIDPGGTPTSYYFQYGPSAAYGQQEPAAPGKSIGSGRGAVEVPAVHVDGLPAGSVVHYRVVAISEPQAGEIETLYSRDYTFTTQAATGSFSLPDGRQWELVSPANKLGALIEPLQGQGTVVQAAADGGALAYRASSPTERDPHTGFAHEETVLSSRGPTGWSTLDISEPNLVPVYPRGGIGKEFQIFSEDLSRAAIQPIEGKFTPFSPEASETTPYLRTDFLNGAADVCRTGCYQPLVTGKAGFANVPAGTVFGGEPEGFCELDLCGPKFQGASPDLSHIVLSSSAQLTSTPAPAGGEGLYEWSEGKLQLLDVLPPGEEGPAVLAGTGYGVGLGVRGSVSKDGERVIMEGGATGGSGVYLREVAAGGQPQGETVRLDVPQGGSGPSKEAIYMDASADGSRIFFLDGGKLMADSSPSGEDLYEYNLNAPAGSHLSDLSAAPKPGQATDVATVIGASEDGSYVYFAAGGTLASGAVEGQCPTEEINGASKGCNLYVRHEGVTRLVAVLPSRDIYDWTRYLNSFHSNVPLLARVSPDGRWLAFLSDGDLAGYDTHDALSGQPDVEVYVYDAASGTVACASCDPTGARPLGAQPQTVGRSDGLQGWAAAFVPAWTDPPTNFGSVAAHQPRYLSDSGRLFFDSTDALVPQDVNGVEDAYEWEPPGVGSCSIANATFTVRSQGCVDLISSGTSPESSEIIDASETGGDVFLRTQSQLAPADYDTAFDVYDAHECTSAAPCPVVRPQPPACSTETSCKTPPAPQPALYGAPASATFSGTGNISQTQLPVLHGKAKPGSKAKSKTRRGRSLCRKRTKRRCAKTERTRRAGRRATRATRTALGGRR